ncbi:MAG: MFS transporter [Myxococcota bacterium]|nr:MFS transporter [Myxococcota bacterium]
MTEAQEPALPPRPPAPTAGAGEAASSGSGDPESAWAPLRRPLFRAIWLASVASQVGTWVHDVGAAWLMTSLSPSPFMVSLVQAAAAVPLFALALPAGALADVVDRRRLLLWTQSWMLASALLLGVCTALGLTGPSLLLAFTVVLSIGAALNAPAWQAITPELVPKAELGPAVALNGMAINLARSVGPAIGGLLVGLSGAQAAFFLNAVSFLAVLVVLARWKRVPKPSTLPAERFSSALRAGLRYARYAEGFRSVLVRAALFLFPASALWALLPHLARRELGLSAIGYGGLMAGIGLGALLAANALPRLRRALPGGRLTGFGTLVVAVTIAGLAVSPDALAAWPTLLVLGSGWLVMLSSLNLGAQATAAGWVRARALSVFLFVFFGSLALGSLAWGAVAEALGVRTTLLVAAGVTALAAWPARFFPLATGAGSSLAPSLHWPAPELDAPSSDDRGPVLVTLTYRVAPADRPALLELLSELRPRRLRDGAFGWNVFEDPDAPEEIVEVFHAASWTDHLRHHERVTEDDRELQQRIQALQSEPDHPKVRHLLAPEK